MTCIGILVATRISSLKKARPSTLMLIIIMKKKTSTLTLRRDFSLSGNYVYSHTTDESEYAQQYGSNGKQLIYIPLHHANAFAEAKWNTWNMTYSMEFTGERKTSMNDNEFFAYQLPYYMLHHITLGKLLNRFRLELRINNITDEEYQTVLWRAMPGRSYEVYLGFKL